MKKGLVRITLVLLLLSFMASMTGFATESMESPTESVESLPLEETFAERPCGTRLEGICMGYEELPETPNLRLASGSTPTLEETLLEACANYESNIDVARYYIPVNKMSDIFTILSMEHSELFVTSAYRYSYTITGGTKFITKISPIYLVPKEELEEKRLELQGYIDDYVTEAQKFSNPLEQVLYVHDRLVLECVYASEAAEKMESGTLTNEDYIYWHAFTLFDQGTVVCQGYAQAFYAIMTELGYEVEMCFNGGHVWNYIKLGDAWYHLDATWDDPVPDREGLVGHNYFLRSDATMKDHSPDEWFSSGGELPTCNDARYENGYIFNLRTGKAIAKEVDCYRMTAWNMDFVSDGLWAGTVLSTPPENGRIKYIYMEDPKSPISIYTSRKDGEGILRGGGAATRTGETMYNSNGSLALRSYTLPTGPASATSGTIYFRDSGTQKPVGTTLEF